MGFLSGWNKFWKGVGNVLSPITSIFGIGEGISNSISQAQQFDYQKDLQQQIFQREDNAVQRRAKDLAAAGLSKTLAAGSSAGAGQVVATQAPQSNVMDRVLMAMQLQKSQAEIKQIQADAANKNAQAGLTQANTLNVSQQTKLLEIKTAMEQNNLDMLPITNAQQRQALMNAREQAKVMADRRYTNAAERQRIYAQIDNINSMTDLNKASTHTKELMYPILEAQLSYQLAKNSMQTMENFYVWNTGRHMGNASPIIGDVTGWAEAFQRNLQNDAYLDKNGILRYN